MTHTLSFAACLVAICTLLSPVLHAEETPKPVVISLSAVGDMTSKYGHEAANLLRPLIVTRLVRDYDCLVLDRSICGTLTTEALLNRLKAVGGGGSSGGSILAADYAIRAHMRNSKTPGHVDVYLYMRDLRHNDDRIPQKFHWSVKADYFQGTKVFNPVIVSESIAKKVADVLSLKAAQKPDDRGLTAPSKPGRVWAVLPFARLNAESIYDVPLAGKFEGLSLSTADADDVLENHSRFKRADGQVTPYRPMTKEEYQQELSKIQSWAEKRRSAYTNAIAQVNEMASPRAGDASLSTAAELAIQELQTITLVDRSSLNAGLAEMRFVAGALNENAGAYIARIAGANNVLLGAVATSSSGYIVIMHLVDAETSLVVGAQELSCDKKERLDEVVRHMVLRLAKSDHAIPKVRESEMWQREREAEFYREELPDGYKVTDYKVVDVGRKPVWLNRIEINYLLMHNDPDYIANDIVPWLRGLLYKPSSAQLDVYVRGVALLDAMLQSKDIASRIRNPILVRANAYLSEWRYEKALALADQHKKLHSGVEDLWADYIRAESMYGLERYAEAVALAKDIVVRSEQGNAAKHDYLNNPCKGTSHLEWEVDHYDKALNLLVVIAQDERARDEKLELYALSKGASGSWERDLRFMTLVAKYEGMEKALQLFPRIWGKNGVNPNIPNRFNGDGVQDLRAADYLLQMGHREEAIEIYQNVASHWYYNKYPLARLAALNGEAEKDAEALGVSTAESRLIERGFKKYSNAAQICPLPDKYKIYCYPIAGSSSNYVARLCKDVSAWMGADVIVGDTVSFPANTLVKEWESHDVHSFSRQILQDVILPDDAVFIFFIAPDILFRRLGGSDVRVFPRGGNPVIFTSINTRHEKVGGMEAASIICNSIMDCAIDPLAISWSGWLRTFEGWGEGFRREKNYCSESGCMKRPRIITQSGIGYPPYMCEKCWKRSASADWDACHEALRSFFKRDIKMLDSAAGARPDVNVEFDWYDPEVLKKTKMAAENGDPNSIYLMGLAYMFGLGIKADEEKSQLCFKQSIEGLLELAESGNKESANNLGRIYLYGYSVLANNDVAFEWFGKAANQGHAKSQLDYAKMIYAGLGTKKDAALAMKWANMASEQGFAPAKCWLGERYFGDQESSERDYTLSASLFGQAADSGYPKGIVMLGDSYRFGRGVPKDITKAVELYTKAADMGCPDALHRMSYIYYFNFEFYEHSIPSKEIPWKYTVRYP